MAASVSGSKTVTYSPKGNISAASLTTILATAPENLSLSQLRDLTSALEGVAGGGITESASLVGDFLS